MVCALTSLYAQSTSVHAISGIILSAQDGAPLIGATVKVKNTNIGTITDAEGKFNLELITLPDTLIISRIGFHQNQAIVKNISKTSIIIELESSNTQLQEVTVSTGYQQIPKERATGSFDFIDNKLLNRSVTTYILDRIENLTPGILFNHGDAANTDPILIRGRSTIYASAAPLIVVDNFPYDGNIGDINPVDIESVSILKDAAAASIWGARAGNGVIIITTKKGKTKKPRIEFNTSLSFSQRPDLFNIPVISSSDYIELEKFLYKKGYYATDFLYPATYNPAVTPVINLLHEVDDGIVSASDANAQIEKMKNHDVRNDLNKYFYRPGISEEHALNISGDNQFVNYYVSAGWDHNLTELVGSKVDRITLRTQNTFRITPNLHVDAGVSYSQNISKSGSNRGYLISGAQKLYPYAQLADNSDNPLPVYLDYNPSLVNEAQQNGLLNWEYVPIRDIYNTTNIGKISDILLNTGIGYKIFPFLTAEIKYQFENELDAGSSFYNDSSYYARSLINQYTQVNPVTGILSYPVPRGGILDIGNSEIQSHQGRAQLNYDHSWNQKHQLMAIGGFEIRSLITTSNNYRLYGYDPELSTVNTNIDYTTTYNLYRNYNTAKIPNPAYLTRKTDHFISYYANAAYSFEGRYTLTASGRKDEANLFGVATNQKGTPLWSVGGSWLISNEPFYKMNWLPYLKFRATYGYNGNISRLASALTTIAYTGTAYTTPASSAYIVNPPNKKLRWERIGMFNVGIDFETKNKIISGTVEYYHKNAKDLMGQAPIDPTLGLTEASGTQSFFYGNIAGMKGQGVDIQLSSININKKFKWMTTFLFSYVNTKVSTYLMPVGSSGSLYLQPNVINPVVGKPLYAIYSFKWGGLDPADGNPIGYLNGKASEDYASMRANIPLDSMIYNGPSTPPYFGALRNTFIYKSWSLSFNISYKLGYYFRIPSISYSQLFATWTGNSDYAKRWQNPGDEKITHVPSLIYPADPNRDYFYLNSQMLVKRADNIRLEDINLSYDLDKERWHHLPFKSLRLFLYISNIGMIWCANSEKTDPYYNGIPKEGKKIACGANIIF